MDARFNPDHLPWTLGNADKNVVMHADRLELPYRWRKPSRVFVNSVSDLFHDNVPGEFIARVFFVMQHSPLHTFQILTKRPERMREFVTARVIETQKPIPSNVWLGVSVEDQHAAEERIPILCETPGVAIRFISCEPLLGPVDLRWAMRYIQGPLNSHIQWVIAGGESGAGARAMEVKWAQSLLARCKTEGIAFFMKQLGGYPNKENTMTALNTWDIGVREFPVEVQHDESQ